MESSYKPGVCQGVRCDVSCLTGAAQGAILQMALQSITVNLTKMPSAVVPASSKVKIGVAFSSVCL